MVKDFIKHNVLKPGLERFGTVLAVWLVGVGASQPVANQIALGVVAAAGLVFDIVVIWLNNRKAKR